MISGKIGTLEDLFNIMNNVTNESFQTPRHTSTPSTASAQGVNASSANVSTGVFTTSSGSASSVPAVSLRSNSRGDGRCFNCFKEGHRAAQCNRPARARGSCFSCGEMGHTNDHI